MVISWGLVYIYYRMVSCSGTAHLSVPFVFFFFLSGWPLPAYPGLRGAQHTKLAISIPVRAKPPLWCLASLSHILYLPSLLLSLSWWRHSILPLLALAPLALSHHSAAGLTGSDVCQRLFFSSRAPEVRAVTEKGFSQVKYDLLIGTEHLGRKMLMWDEPTSHPKDWQA